EKWQFIATARLWLQSSYDPAYLLRGEALKRAAQYKDAAPELRELVEASEAKAERWRAYGAAGLAVLVSACLVIVAYQLYDRLLVPYWARQITAFNASDDVIRWLANHGQKIHLARLQLVNGELSGLDAEAPE